MENNTYSYDTFDTMNSSPVNSNKKNDAPGFRISFCGFLLTTILIFTITTFITNFIMYTKNADLEDIVHDGTYHFMSEGLTSFFSMDTSDTSEFEEYNLDLQEMMPEDLIESLSSNLSNALIGRELEDKINEESFNNAYDEWTKLMITSYCMLYLQDELYNMGFVSGYGETYSNGEAKAEMEETQKLLADMADINISDEIKNATNIVLADEISTGIVNASFTKQQQQEIIDIICGNALEYNDNKAMEFLDSFNELLDEVNASGNTGIFNKDKNLKRTIGTGILIILSIVIMILIYKQKYRALRNCAIAGVFNFVSTSFTSLFWLILVNVVGASSNSKVVENLTEKATSALVAPYAVGATTLLITFIALFVCSSKMKKAES